ncbi:MAG: serine/threonine protein kinase, partial [Myxococcales bacterium]|nr:serine/threonine protein kinase [Myxococcales bacterium]
MKPEAGRATCAPSVDDTQPGVESITQARRSGPTWTSLDGDREPAPPLADPQGPVFPPLPDRYEAEELLGEGGMGEVWRVQDRVLHRSVALKVVRPPLLLSKRGLQRFREEAQVAAQLQHPGIVPVHELGRLDDERLYFTMQEVRGRTLREVIQEVHANAQVAGSRPSASGWTFRRLIDVFRRVCETVAYAHARGVVHRDLKPQ